MVFVVVSVYVYVYARTNRLLQLEHYSAVLTALIFTAFIQVWLAKKRPQVYSTGCEAVIHKYRL